MKVPEETVLSPPKSIEQTAAFAVNPEIEDEFQIKHPRAVKEAEVHETSDDEPETESEGDESPEDTVEAESEEDDSAAEAESEEPSEDVSTSEPETDAEPEAEADSDEEDK